MSTTLSMISRQLVFTTVVAHAQSVHAGSAGPPSIRGMACSGIGGLPSGSCQTKTRPSWVLVCQVRVRARRGTRRE